MRRPAATPTGYKPLAAPWAMPAMPAKPKLDEKEERPVASSASAPSGNLLALLQTAASEAETVGSRTAALQTVSALVADSAAFLSPACVDAGLDALLLALSALTKSESDGSAPPEEVVQWAVAAYAAAVITHWQSERAKAGAACRA